MRVIAGKYKSRKLTAPVGSQTRPTSDQLRETLFNVVAASVPGSVWLDLFAGTGAVGIEAISRGAEKVYFVESSKTAVRGLRRNLADLKIESGFEVMERDVVAALRHLNAQGVKCDFCFLDPPYRKSGDYEQVLEWLPKSNLLNAGAIVIAEHDKHFDPGNDFGPMKRVRLLKQGDAVLSFYRRE
ncbi:MAG TPA: 16S rRNA (guanine(966)-N(2))-methyltransferase RsmD [Alphaproteobacteria bacterium]|nr:16S rRNA (guanine(966)-N(2))-methyltransferase RsmD [Alphaproteobacteria bacterium]